MKLLLNTAINRHYIRDLAMEMIGIPFCREKDREREREGVMQLETYAYIQRRSFCLSQF